MQFLIAHSDTIQAILRCQEMSVGSLQELALLTGIISKAALPGESTVLKGLRSWPTATDTDLIGSSPVALHLFKDVSCSLGKLRIYQYEKLVKYACSFFIVHFPQGSWTVSRFDLLEVGTANSIGAVTVRPQKMIPAHYKSSEMIKSYYLAVSTCKRLISSFSNISLCVLVPSRATETRDVTSDNGIAFYMLFLKKNISCNSKLTNF